MASLASRHPLFAFFALAYALSWLVFFPIIAFDLPIEWIMLASFGPCLAALIVNYARERNWSAFLLLGLPLRALIATAIGIALTILAFVVLPAVFTANPTKLHWGIFLSTSVYNYSTILGGPLGEEFGWRGYALMPLEQRFGPTLGSGILSLLWIGWHLPLFLLPTWVSAPFWIYALIVIGFSFIISFAANLARFAVIPAILIHAIFNTVSNFLGGLFRDTQPNTSLPFELALAFGGISIATLLIVFTKGNLGFSLKRKVLDKVGYSF